MRNLLIIAVVLFGLQVGYAQTPTAQVCPSIYVTAPAGITQPPDPVWFIATIDGPVPKDIRFHWTVTKGRITHGQGTSKIDTQPENENNLNITATVEIDGLPEGCYRVASETYSVIIDNFEPILMFDVSTSELDVDLGICVVNTVMPRYNAIVKELEENPTNQAHIVFSHKPETSSDVAKICERGVIQFFTNAGIDRSRITARRKTDEKESVQFWRVPPGREDPTCDDCENVYNCPEISITGPPGITLPGDSMEFKAQISGNVPDGVRYEWTVSAGQIIDGQGTQAIKVRSPEQDLTNLTATIRVLGLPGGCTLSESETAPVAPILDPILVDEFVGEGLQLEKGRLESAANELKERKPEHVLYIIEYFPPKTSGFDIREKQRNIAEFLTKHVKLNENNFKIVTAEGPEFRTRIYRLAPGFSFPEP